MRLFSTVMTFIILIMLILFSYNIVQQQMNPEGEQNTYQRGSYSCPDDDEESSLLRSFKGDSVILVKQSKPNCSHCRTSCQTCRGNDKGNGGISSDIQHNKDIQLIEVESGQTGETSDLIMESYEFKLQESGAKQGGFKQI